VATVTLEQVRKVYPNGVEAVKGLDLHVEEGEFVVLVGPSGCGKTTALRMVAGLEDITSGILRFGDRVMNDVSPKDRDVAMVFQNYALYPHMTVAENIGFALKLRKVPKAVAQAKIKEAASILGLTEMLDRKPAQLSGGQRQRVAMGRAIVREPSVFLMDEPLSNLDAKLRVQMRAEVLRIQRRVGVATLYVTHDQTEAMTMGDRVAVMRLGELQQYDKPQVLYDHPRNLFVATFIGSPAMNLYEAGLSSEDGAPVVHLGSQVLKLKPDYFTSRPGLSRYVGRKVVLGIRPEHLADPRFVGDAVQSSGEVVAEVELVEALGSELLVHFRIDAPRIRAEIEPTADADGSGEVSAAALSEGIARIDPRSDVKVGQQARFTVDLDRLHFFDPDTGESIVH
jgi:multiple sugar transport system ATP-binding protein